MKIFVIDDDDFSIFLTKYLLKRESFEKEVFSFLSAEEALETLLKDDMANVPDVILLDLNMPHMSGWDFMDAIAPYKDRLLNKCSIYILTSSLALTDTAKSKEYDLINGYFHKPLDAAIIQEIFPS